MTKLEDHDNWLLMQKLNNGGRKKLFEWIGNIVDEFFEEQAIKECTLFDNVKHRFDDDFHDSFLCTIPTLLFKFLIDKGVAHIVEPRPPLETPCYMD